MSREWTYSYKTSDGAWHEGLVSAESRDAAYDAIRAKGIRPAKVSERIAPVVRRGFRGLRRRDWLFVSAAVFALVATSVLAIAFAARAPFADGGRRGALATARVRRQIESIPPDFPHRLFSAFKFNSERFLALYAQPGMPRHMLDGGRWLPSLNEVPPRAIEFSLDDLADALGSDIFVYPEDPRWLADLKRIVVGMKDEAGTLFRSGKGSGEIALWLDERNKMEAAYRAEAVRKVRSGEVSAESADLTLRTMGLKGISK